MTDDPVATAARGAAGQLSASYGPKLAVEVESALLAHGTGRRPDQYIDPVSLGSLIVSIASLAWTIYIAMKDKTPNPAADVLAREIHVQLRTHGDAPAPAQDHIIDVVVNEIIREARDPD